MSVWTEGIPTGSEALVSHEERPDRARKGPRTYGERPCDVRRRPHKSVVIDFAEFMKRPTSKWVPWIRALGDSMTANANATPTKGG